MSERKKILILCTGNSARSQMAEGLLKHITQNEYEIFSAGTKPSFVRQEAITVLHEVGIDISGNSSKSVDEFSNQKIDFVFTVCDSAREICPYFPAQTKFIHHSFEDPAEVQGIEEIRLEAFRQTRDEIQNYIRDSFCNILGNQ